MLAGGIPFGYLTQFSGPPASGKTQLALHLAAAAQTNTPTPQQHHTRRCWYITSSVVQPLAQRLAELCQNNYAVLEGTVFCTATDEYQVLAHLAALESELIIDATVVATSTAERLADSRLVLGLPVVVVRVGAPRDGRGRAAAPDAPLPPGHGPAQRHRLESQWWQQQQ